MRIKPSLAIAVVLTVVYTVLVIGTGVITQPDGASFEDAFDDLDNSRYVVYMLATGVVFGVLVATLGGWWKDIFANDRQIVGPLQGWQRFVPLVLLLLVAATTDYGNIADYEMELLGWIIAASVLVGISEELMFRGNVLVCLRRAPMSEGKVWFSSSVLFALIHFGNVGLDASPAQAIPNTVIAFFGGTMLYAMRRASGSIVVAMAFHGLWDFTTFTDDTGALGFFRLVVMVALVIALIVGRDRLFPKSEPEPEPVEATS